MEKTLTNLQGTGTRRFEALLSGSSSALYDKPLLERDDWLVAPTVGAIVSGWLLVLPRKKLLSFRDWAKVGGPRPLSVVDEIRSYLGLEHNDIIWFEHGPASANTVVGCGLDHAHIHILLKPSFSHDEFFERARSMSELNWRASSISDCYQQLPSLKSYFTAGSGEQAIWASDVEGAGSQFFRRVVASLADAMSDWDYRQFTNLQKIEETVSIFRRLENAS